MRGKILRYLECKQTMNQIQLEDCKTVFNQASIVWKDFSGSTILVTGSTGLIGSNFVYALLYAKCEKNIDMDIILAVRNKEAAEALFGTKDVKIIGYDVTQRIDIEEKIDYIVHMASPTSSKFFSERPVDTLCANFEGTKEILELAKEKAVKKVIFISSMEVYGFPERGHKVSENEVGGFETMNARNSYPIAKIASEALCNAYHSQYGVPAVILRATQTFGPGVKYDDNRVFAQFMRCALEKKNIVLKSRGETERSYVYTADIVSALLICLQKAPAGEAFTVANPDTYCSIKEMAELVANEIAGGEIEVQFDIAEDIQKLGYAGTLFMDLDTSKIENLGWKATTGLKDMFLRMMTGLEK